MKLETWMKKYITAVLSIFCAVTMLGGCTMDTSAGTPVIPAATAAPAESAPAESAPAETASPEPVEMAASAAETASEETVLAELISPEEIKDGDRVILVNTEKNKSFSKWFRDRMIETGNVKTAMINGKQAVTYMSDETQVLEVEKEEDGFYFKSRNGYIRALPGGKYLTYTEEKSSECKWFFDGDRMYAMAEDDDQNSVKGYASLWSNSSGFGWTDKFWELDPGLLAFSVYRVTSAYDDLVKSETGYSLPLFHTSDVHGYLMYDDNTDWQMRLAYISYLVNQARHRNGQCRPDEVLLLDSGDVFMGSTLSNLLQWQPMAAVFDTMQYDAVTVGNHEFDKGLEYAIKPDGTMMDYELNGVKHINTVPFTMCNLYQNGKKVDWIPEYLILDKTAVDENGNELRVKIGVIGFSEDYGGTIMAEKFADLGYEIREDYDYLNSLAKNLKEKQNCDAVVVLMHGNSDVGAEGLGADSPVDVVLGGHLHKFRFGVTESGLKYAQPGNKGDSVIEAEMIFQKKDGKADLVTVKDVHPRYITDDKEYLYDREENYDHLDRYVLNTGNAYLLLLAQIIEVKIGYITVDALRREYIPDSGKHACTAGNWNASMLQRIADADVGIVNLGSLRQDYTIPEGSDHLDIEVGDIYTMFPFDDPVYVFRLTYEEFLELMKYAVAGQGRTLMSYMMGIDCYYDDDKDTVNAIVTKDGEAVYEHGVWKDGWKDKTLTVAMKAFMATSERGAEDGQHNPCLDWVGTDRLIRQIDELTDPVLDVLTTEAENNNGHLEIDEKAHFLALEYTGGN